MNASESSRSSERTITCGSPRDLHRDVGRDIEPQHARMKRRDDAQLARLEQRIHPARDVVARGIELTRDVGVRTRARRGEGW